MTKGYIMSNIHSTENTEDSKKNDNILYDLTTGQNYENSTKKYQDNLSSAITFFICGIAGLIVVLLNLAGILHFFSVKTSSGIFITICLSLLFIAFLAIGVMTYKTACKAKSLIVKENKINEEISSWLKENLTKEIIDASFNGNEMAEEMKYFDRSNYIVKAIKEQYPDLNEDIIQSLTDEYIQEIYH